MERDLSKPLDHDFTGELLTAGEVAGILKIAEGTVRRYVQEGALEAVRVGPRKLYRIRGESLQNILHPQKE